MLRQHIEMIYESNTPPSLFTNILLHSSMVMPEGPWVHDIPGNTQRTLVAQQSRTNFNPKHLSARENKQNWSDYTRLHFDKNSNGKKETEQNATQTVRHQTKRKKSNNGKNTNHRKTTEIHNRNVEFHICGNPLLQKCGIPHLLKSTTTEMWNSTLAEIHNNRNAEFHICGNPQLQKCGIPHLWKSTTTETRNSTFMEIHNYRNAEFDICGNPQLWYLTNVEIRT